MPKTKTNVYADFYVFRRVFVTRYFYVFSLIFQVTEIEGRSALLKWGPPIRDQGDGMAKFEPLEHISEADFRYEVCLSDKGKDGKYR